MNVRSGIKLLLVEDEVKVATFIKKGLETQAYAVDVAFTGGESKRLLDTNPYDVVVLDVSLPDLSGLELAQYIRRRKNPIPVLMLTALDTTADKLLGFEAGADDYLAKSFDSWVQLKKVYKSSRLGYILTILA